ncbi:MAG: alpha/beta hydrolase [Bacteroidales bacterium]|jgi:pimeloyl-ACP methyl ester carboxylesterase|nr:alpha/beta hydrolase [Bacteroidales bacterium]
MKQFQQIVNEKKIAYYDTQTSGLPVVLIHGTSLASVIFIRQMIDPGLSQTYRFIALDLPGCGDSDSANNPENDYTIQMLASDIVGFCKKLNLNSPVFIGHDFGGNVLLEALPDLPSAKAIALVCSVPLTNPLTPGMFLPHPAVPLLSKAGIDDSDIHQIAASLMEPGSKYPDFLPELMRISDIRYREVFFNSLNEGAYRDQYALLKELKIPVALFLGEKDQLINADYLKNIAIPRLWHKNILTIKDAGHLCFYENPADFNTTINGFLQEIV